MSAMSFYNGRPYMSTQSLRSEKSKHNNAAYNLQTAPSHTSLSASSYATSRPSETSYNHVPTIEDSDITDFETRDRKLKRRVRQIKFVSRIVTALASLATFIPLVMTLVKFKQTQNTYVEVNGHMRTAWAHDTITWPTYTFFAISLISVVLNITIMIAYSKDILTANKVASIASWFSIINLVGHVVVWVVATILYRVGKIPRNGKSRDLWGWTCSSGAQEIQKVFEKQVNFDSYCNIQTSSFYAGIVTASASILTVVVYFFALQRMHHKKAVEKAAGSGLKKSASREALRNTEELEIDNSRNL